MGDSVKKAEVKQTNGSNNSLQFQKFCKYLDSYKYLESKNSQISFHKSYTHVILKQQQRKALSFTSNQQMAVDHSN